MDVHNFNPEECLERIIKIVEEIPSGVSLDTLKSTIEVPCPEELHSFITDSLTSRYKEAIERLWTICQIPEKLKQLKELDKKSPKEVAWRPTTGEAPVTPFIIESTRNTIEELQHNIELVEEESTRIQSYLKHFHEKVQHQIEEMHSIESLYND